MDQTIASLPDYLKTYVVDQSENGGYTARDHAAWRFIMRQSRSFFKDHALPIYLDGLEQTGITTDRIPLIREMNEKLRRLGWGAVPVRGFIPPAAFLDFQARRILPIASDMRTVDHLDYTPAPDIVHEAAGHAPILADPEYSNYLTKYAGMAQKAIFTREDLNLYEAIRTLSDVKENPDSTPDLIAQAQAQLEQAVASVKHVSEANKTARMNWWTVEYGLLGNLQHPKIYGAGLLSSVGESQNCLSSKVKKIPLTVDCTETSYDITEPQPQLFVAESIDHLIHVLEEFEQRLAYRRGGLYGLEEARIGRTVTTTVLDSGLQISGIVDSYLHEGERVDFIKWSGPTQLAAGDQELPGHGVDFHAHGFSSPIGRWQARPDQDPATFTTSQLNDAGLQKGARCELQMVSGFTIKGVLADWLYHGDRLLSLKWQDCKVTRGNEVFFQPEWGDFDMAIGTSVVSVYGGPADRVAFGGYDVGKATTSPQRQTPFSETELKIFDRYQTLRDMRNSLRNAADESSVQKLLAFIDDIEANFTDEWLLRLECIELAKEFAPDRSKDLETSLRNDRSRFADNISWLIDQGLQLATH